MTTEKYQGRKGLGKLLRKQLVKCICPRCEKIHKRFILWTGRGTPRIYCNSGASGCNVIAEDIYEVEAHEVNNNTDIVNSLLEFA